MQNENGTGEESYPREYPSENQSWRRGVTEKENYKKTIKSLPTQSSRTPLTSGGPLRPLHRNCFFKECLPVCFFVSLWLVFLINLLLCVPDLSGSLSLLEVATPSGL